MLNLKNKVFIYDFEVFQEDWMVVVKDYETKKYCKIINNPNMLKTLYNKFKDAIWIGYNNRHFDQIIFKSILLDMNPKEVSDRLIDGEKGYMINRNFSKMQMYNYDCMILNTSLKKLEGFMGESIKETSVDFNTKRKLTDAEIEEVMAYCEHDVNQTELVFENTINEFHAHKGLIDEFGLSDAEYGRTKAQLASIILNADKKLVTTNDEFDYVIPDCFELGKYEYVRDWYLKEENKTYHILNDRGTTVSNQLKTDIMGVPNTLGFGGIHGAVNKYINDDGFFVMSDIASMYPATMINFDLISRTVENRDKYRQIRDNRLKLKKEGDKREYPLKILLNSVFGVQKDVYSPMYDPRNANSICIVGQLAIIDLCDKIEDALGENVELIQSNTDGILVKLKDETYYSKYISVCKAWESRTKYDLEHDVYKKVFQKDVNNYIIVDDKGEFKAKGGYVGKLSKLKYDLPIINKALTEYFVNNTPVEDTINNCDDLIEFQKINAIGRMYEGISYGDKEMNERVIRVFASKKGLPGVFKIKMKQNKFGDMVNVLEKLPSTPESAFIVNGNVNGMKCPDNLDREYYIDIANNRIDDFLGIKRKKGVDRNQLTFDIF